MAVKFCRTNIEVSQESTWKHHLSKTERVFRHVAKILLFDFHSEIDAINLHPLTCQLNKELSKFMLLYVRFSVR